MKYEVNFRCFYISGDPCDHRRVMDINEIGKWIEAYKFTHPSCTSITVKVWLAGEKEE